MPSFLGAISQHLGNYVNDVGKYLGTPNSATNQNSNGAAQVLGALVQPVFNKVTGQSGYVAPTASSSPSQPSTKQNVTQQPNPQADTGDNTTPTNTNTGGGGSYNPSSVPSGPGFAGTGSGGSTNTDSTDINSLINNEMNLAKQNAANTISGYNSTFDAQKNNFQNELNQLGTQKDSVLQQISDVFQNLLNGITSTGQQNINQLNEQGDQTKQQYNQAGTDVRNTLQDAQRQNRSLARAMGDLDSSFYEGMQGNSTQQAQQDADQLAGEEANNLNAIGNRVNEVNTTMGNNISDVNKQEADQKAQALQTYQQNYDSINNDLTLNEQDRQNMINDLNNQLSQALNQIQTNYLNYKLQAFISQYGPAALPALSQISFSGPDTTSANQMLSNLNNMGSLNLPSINAPTQTYAFQNPQQSNLPLNQINFGNSQGQLNTNNTSPSGTGANANVTALPFDPTNIYNRQLSPYQTGQ